MTDDTLELILNKYLKTKVIGLSQTAVILNKIITNK